MAANILPLLNPRALSEDEVSPFGGILRKVLANKQALEAIRQQQLANQFQQERLPYAKQFAEVEANQGQANLLKQQISNRFEAPRADRAEDFAKAELATSQAEAPYKQAMGNLATQKAEFFPLTTQIAQTNAQTRQNSANSQASNVFRLWAQTPEGQKIIASDPQQAEAIYKTMENLAAQISGNQQFQSVPNAPMQMPGQGNQQPQQMQQNQLPFSNGQASKLDQMNANIPQAPTQNIAPSQDVSDLAGKLLQDKNQKNEQSVDLSKPLSRNDILKEIQKGAEDKYIRSNYPADIQKRLYAGNRVKATAPQVMKAFYAGANKYFGPEGAVLLKADEKLEAKRKVTPESLQAYRNFRQGLEQLNVQGAMLEGVPADQISRGQFQTIFDIPKFFNTSVGAEEQLKGALNYLYMADEANQARPSDLLKKTLKDENFQKSIVPQVQKQSMTNTVGVQSPDGKEYDIPAEKVEALLKKHPSFKRIS